MINLLWVAAIAFAFGFGSVPGLLVILCLFVLDLLLEIKQLTKHAETLAKVFTEPGPELTPAENSRITDSVTNAIALHVFQPRRWH